MDNRKIDGMIYEQKSSRNNFLSIIINFLVAGLIFTFLYTMSVMGAGYDFTLSSDARMITGWQYSNREALFDDDEHPKSAEAFSLTQIKKYNRGEYLYLTAQIVPSDFDRRLVLQTFYNPVRVSINDEQLFDNMKPDSLFGEGFVSGILIPPSHESVTVNIIMRSALLPKLQAFVTSKEYSGVPLTLFGLLGLLVTALTLVLSIFFIGFWRIGGQRNNQLRLSGVVGIFVCTVVFIEYMSIFVNPSANTFWMRLGFILQMAAGLLIYYRIMLSLNALQGMPAFAISIGGLYAAVVFICPYQPLLVWLIQYFGIYYLLICLLLLPRLCKKYFSSGEKKRLLILADTLLLIIYTAYWISFLTTAQMNLSQWVVAAVLQQTIAFAFSSQEKTNTPQAETEDTADLMRFKPNGSGPFDDIIEVFLQNKVNLYHVRNVSLYVYAICRQANMTTQESELIAQAAFLHDIGKTMISVKIITKVGILTSDEYEKIKEHTQNGYKLLSSRDEPFFKMAAIIAMQHHERYDGKGYYGMRGADIDKFSKIVCIADVFDALTTERSYKNAWSFDESFDYVANHSGSLFDPQLVDYFIQCRSEIYKIYCDTRNQ